MSEKLTELELADAVLDALEGWRPGAASSPAAESARRKREILEALFRDLRARGAL